MKLRDLVWHPAERRLRTPLRLPLQAGLVVGVTLLVGLLASLAGFAVGSPLAVRLPVPRALGAVAFGGGVVLAIWLGSLLLDRREFADFGFDLDRLWWLDLAFGLALGAAAMALIFAVELLLGWITVTGTLRAADAAGAVLPAFLAVLVVFVVVGFYEELVFRGYLVRNLAEGLTWFDAVSARTALVAAGVATSLLFGVGHAFNPNATVASTLGITAAGGFLALAYLLTGELGVPVGFHVTWNLFQGPVFGFPVSGAAFGVNLVVVEQTGPAVATGGPFGPEAGLVGLGALLGATGALAWWVRYTRGSVAIHESLATPTLRWRE